MIAAAEVVPGDVLLLEAGDIVAADARLLEAHALSTNEAALTGESAPVEKRPTPAPRGRAAGRAHRLRLHGHVGRGGHRRAPRWSRPAWRPSSGKIAHLLATARATRRRRCRRGSRA